MLDGENVYTLLKTAEELLKSKGLFNPKSDAEVLLSFVLQTKRSKLPLLRNQKPSNKQILQYEDYILKRSNREPAAYITGFAGFMGFEFKVDKNVLIPRPETELLVEVALKMAKEENKKSVLDLCTGSGCIAVSLAKLGVFEDIVASDISVNALAIAKENAQINNASNIKFIESDVFGKISDRKIDMIVSNPPYVAEPEYADLEIELKFEPKNALTAQDDGLFFYKEIAANASKYLNSGGYIFLELNSNKAEDIRQIFLDNKYADIEVINDYSGLPRILKAIKS
ncbi:MAG: peptide chain release factor N(5)-glutamine methyltransferase [Endomicrobium sp.]|jgi:release factor glutamine methyltransferase|nr:peptide chain release factor N(5)-glutamine methyltransferase [Endomicrobium sp.]